VNVTQRLVPSVKALHDAIARGFGVRVCDLVGGCAATRIPAYASTGFFSDDPERQLHHMMAEAADHPYAAHGIPETMSVDQTVHSLFGASKIAADVLVQEYGRYFGMKTACFRGGCLTGPNHSGTQLHGFLAYLMKCAVTQTRYTIFGYKKKQVRDNIHSADLIRAFHEFYKQPRSGQVYNMGGGRYSNCSMLEAIAICEQITGRPLESSYVEQNRRGDHIWWVSDISRFQQHYPDWKMEYEVPQILQEIYEFNHQRWSHSCATPVSGTSLAS